MIKFLRGLPVEKSILVNFQEKKKCSNIKDTFLSTIDFNNLKYPKNSITLCRITSDDNLSSLRKAVETFTKTFIARNWPPYSSFRQPRCGPTFANRARLYAILNPPPDSSRFPPVFRPHTRVYTHTHTYTQLRTAKLFLLATTYTLLSLPFAFQQVRNAWAREEDGLLSRTAGGRTGWWKVLATNPLLRGRGKFGLIRGIVASGRTIPYLVMQLHAQLLPSPFEDVSSVAVARGHLPLNTRVFFFFFSSLLLSSKPTFPRSRFPTSSFVLWKSW